MTLRLAFLGFLLAASFAALVFFYRGALPLDGMFGDKAFGKSPFESICLSHHEKYNATLCADIGKHAYTTQAVIPINDADLGLITGVAWRNKGGVISRPTDVKRFSES